MLRQLNLANGQRFKARPVAKDFPHCEVIDYNKTHTLVVNFTSVCVYQWLLMTLSLMVHRITVVTAFLNFDLKECVYVKQPKGFAQKGKKNHLCRLHRAIYGLVQQSGSWHKRIIKFLAGVFGLHQNPSDNFLYSSTSSRCAVTFARYVDDLWILCSKSLKLSEVKSTVGIICQIQDPNNFWCLKFKVNQDFKVGLPGLSQKRYTETISTRFGMKTAKGFLNF